MKILLFVICLMTFSYAPLVHSTESEKLEYDPHKDIQTTIENLIFKKADFILILNVLEKDKTVTADQAKQLRDLLSKMSEQDFNNLLKEKAMNLLKGNSKTSAAHSENPTDGLNPQLLINELLVKIQKAK